MIMYLNTPPAWSERSVECVSLTQVELTSLYSIVASLKTMTFVVSQVTSQPLNHRFNDFERAVSFSQLLATAMRRLQWHHSSQFSICQSWSQWRRQCAGSMASCHHTRLGRSVGCHALAVLDCAGQSIGHSVQSEEVCSVAPC